MSDQTNIPENSAVPSSRFPAPCALFSCSNPYCEEEVSYHADQLHWYDPEKRFVCEQCWGDLPRDEDGNPPHLGINLKQWLLHKNYPLSALLQ